MSERKPSEDLKDGLFLLYRAARGAAKEINTERVEKTINTSAKELARVIENVGKSLSQELDKTFGDKKDPPAPPRP